MNADDWMLVWTAVYAIATCVLAGGIFLAIWQIMETRRSTSAHLKATRVSTNAHVAVEMFQELHSDDNLNLLRYIYSLKPENFKDLMRNQTYQIERAVSRLNLLGFFVANDIIDEAIAIESLAGVTALKCWYQLHSFIRQARHQRGYFADDFEDFARRSLDYFSAAKREILFYRKDEEDKIIDLISELREDEIVPRRLNEIRASTISRQAVE